MKAGIGSILNDELTKISKLEDSEEEVLNDFDSIIEEVYNKDMYAGRSREALRGGALLIACRSNSVPVIPKEISNNFEDTNPREIIISQRYIISNIESFSYRPIKWKDFLDRFSDELELEQKTVDECYKIAELGKQKGLVSGRKPRNYAVASIYFTVQSNAGSNRDNWITQRVLSDKADVSESSIRNTYKELVSVSESL